MAYAGQVLGSLPGQVSLSLLALLNFSSTEGHSRKQNVFFKTMQHNSQEAASLDNGNVFRGISVAKCFLEKKGIWRKNNLRRLDFTCIQCRIYTESGSKYYSSEKKKKRKICPLERFFFCTERIHILRPQAIFSLCERQTILSLTNKYY